MLDVRRRLKRIGLGLACLAGVVTAPAGAVGIGVAKVESYLGEPLRVRITLSFAPGENITNACVRIAAPPGMESPFIADLARARFQMIEGPQGAELVITTNRPYTDPILVFPLKVGCGAGGVYREITLLIDPPGMAAPTRAARAAPAPRPTETRPAPRVVRKTAAPVKVEGGQWYVDRGETLTGIIVDSGLDGGDRKRRLQLIDEVVAANPDVFRGRGPDYLPAGATLTLPGWNGSKAKGGAPVLTEPEAVEERQAEPPPEPPQPTVSKEEEFRLELSGQRQNGEIVSPEMKAIEEELARINAASAEERKLNAELQDRLLQLRQQAAELQLVAERMARENGQVAPSAEQTTDTQAPGQAAPEAAQPAGGPVAEAATPAPAPVMVTPPAGLPAPQPPAPPAEPSIMEWVNENLLLLAGAVFAVLLFLAFLVRRGGSASQGPTLDELIAQKELERAAQLREIEEAAEAVHGEMLAASERHAAEQEQALAQAREESRAQVRKRAGEGTLDETPMPEADAGHFIFSVEEVDSLLEQAEVLLLFGEPEKAIMMVEEYLDGPGAESMEPRPWLKLFHLLRAEERRTEFEERAIAFKRRFNIEKPSWSTFPPDSYKTEGVNLEEGVPHVAQRIQDLWGTPGKALAYIDALLLDDRDGERTGFPIGIAEDLMLLRDIAARCALVGGELHPENH